MVIRKDDFPQWEVHIKKNAMKTLKLKAKLNAFFRTGLLHQAQMVLLIGIIGIGFI